MSQVFSDVVSRGLKGINFPCTTPAEPFSPCWFIRLFCSSSPGGMVYSLSIFWKTTCLEEIPDTAQVARVRWFYITRGCNSPWGFRRISNCWKRTLRISTSISIRRGFQLCDSHTGVIRRRWSNFSFWTFWRYLPIKANGGETRRCSMLHGCDRASTAAAWGSEKKQTHLLNKEQTVDSIQQRYMVM